MKIYEPYLIHKKTFIVFDGEKMNETQWQYLFLHNCYINDDFLTVERYIGNMFTCTTEIKGDILW